MKKLSVLPVTVCIHLALAILVGSNLPGQAQTDWPNPVISEFANDPGAMEIISNILATPPPSQTVSNFSTASSSPPGIYWSLQGKLPPSPFDSLPALPYYPVNSSNNIYIIDDRGVDFSALFHQAGEQATNASGEWGASMLSPLAGSHLPGRAQTNWPSPANSDLAQIPGAEEVISNILATPPPAQAVTDFSKASSSVPGIYWDLQGKLPPSPFDPLPALPYYPVNPSNNIYIIDDRGVVFSALYQQAADQARNASGERGASMLRPLDFTNSTDLWLEIPAGGVEWGNLTVILHNTSEGQPYTLLTKQSLTDPSWVEEQLLYGTNGDSTTTQLPINGRTNLFVWARSGVPLAIDSTSLWLEVPEGGVDGTNLTVVVHNTDEGQAYTLLTKQSLTDPSWVEERLLYGTNGDSTTIQLPINGQTNFFVWARSGVPVSLLAIVSQPLDQEILEGDTVTFSVAASGSGPLTYQWTTNGTNIPGANGSSYTIGSVQDSDAAGYAVTVSNSVTSVTSRTAQLTVDGGTGDPLLMEILGPRQDYSFINGMTYYVDSAVELYGTTTLRGGSVIKFDPSANSSLVVKGALVCETEPYYPAILTSVDDDSQGEWLYWVSTGDPQTAANGAAYLNLDAATSHVISNLRICYADQGVTTPVTPGALDVWDCQFFDCNYGIVNLVPAFGSVDFLHNVLFARCRVAVGASTNSIEIEAEHVTAEAEDFWVAGATPLKIGLTNSIIRGGFCNAAITINEKSAINPSGRNFQKAEQGNYYLASDSSLHGFGTTSVSQRLLAEFAQKTTSRPISFPAFFQTGGNMTLFPQAPRYTNGPPDIGYWYDALDYTVASLTLSGGNLTVLPGTAIGIRNDYIWSAGYWTIYGFYVNQGGSITSHGTPTKPNIFTAADLVQEKPNINFAEYQIDYSEYAGDWLPGIVSFVTDFEPGDPTSPTLDFRFSHFYVPAADIHFCSGLSYDDFWFFSASSSVNLNLQDCSLHNGQVNLGQPDDYDFAQDQIFGSGAVTWNNTMFENVTINLDPTFHELGVDDQGLNVDLSFQACNNLFRGGQWMHLEPVVSTSAGNWVLQDNLFDQVNFIQDINQPLDFDYNGYWPLTADSVAWDAYLDPWAVPNTNYLQTTITLDGFTDGNNEQYLSTAPPYQCGPFGHYYMPTNTILYQAGSRTADAAGFCQYSTRVDQTKENIGETVDIGLHYVAAGNSPSGWVPLDTDGDGIPDYVEDRLGNGATGSNAVALGETDWTTAHTIPGVWDPTNSVYNNVDSSGDGLVGQAKKALEMQPLDTSNPLTLVQQPNGPDSNIVTFIAPANFAGVSSVGCLSLLVDGRPASFVACESGPNGGCLLSWDITYAVPGQHYIQSQFSLYGQPISGGWGVLGVASINPGTPPYPYPLIPGTAQWNNSSVADRLASLNLPQSWTNTATSWQLFSTAIATPYFRTIVVLGVSITDSYTAAKLGTASILNTVEASPDFGANTLYFLESLDVTAVDSVPCSQSSQPCCWMDYIIVCHMASLDTCLNTMNEESIQELFGLAAWDANYFILIGDTTVATAPVSLMYAIYNMPESSRGSLPPNVALPTLTAQESTDMDQGTLDTELTSPISSVVSELGLTNRP